MEPVQLTQLHSRNKRGTAACESLCTQLQGHGYAVLKLPADSARLLSRAQASTRALFADQWFTTDEGKRVLGDASSARFRGTGYRQLHGKQLLQLQPDGSEASSVLSQKLKDPDWKVMTELHNIASKVLDAVLMGLHEVVNAEQFLTLLGSPPSAMQQCDSILHASYYDAPQLTAAAASGHTVSEAAGNTETAAGLLLLASAHQEQDGVRPQPGYGARKMHVDRGFLTIITEDAPGLLVQHYNRTVSSPWDGYNINSRSTYAVVLVGYSLQQALPRWFTACHHAVSVDSATRLSFAYKLLGKPTALIDHEVLLKFPAAGRKRTIREVEADLEESIHAVKRTRSMSKSLTTATASVGIAQQPLAPAASAPAAHVGAAPLPTARASARAAHHGAAQQPAASSAAPAARLVAVQQPAGAPSATRHVQPEQPADATNVPCNNPSAGRQEEVIRLVHSSTPPEDTLRLWCVNQAGHGICFVVRTKTNLDEVRDAYCERMAVTNDDTHFVFEGDKLYTDTPHPLTPARLGMEDGDVIDVMVKQRGD